MPETDVDAPLENGPSRVRMLARYAALSLSPEREAPVAAILDAWIPAAEELSRKMSAAAHQDLLPITVLVHAASAEEGAS